MCITPRKVKLSGGLFLWQNMQRFLDEMMTNNDQKGTEKAENPRFLENGQCPTKKTGGENHENFEKSARFDGRFGNTFVNFVLRRVQR